MKKTFSSAAALAVALFAGSALASSPQVTVGGFADFTAAVSDQDSAYDAGVRDLRFQNDTEIHVSVDGRTDGGLGYGAVVELEADVSNDAQGEGINADKTYIYLDGLWGRVELGSNLSASDSMRVDASNVARGGLGIDGDFRQYITIPTAGFISSPQLPSGHGAALSNVPGATEDANKVTYYSPNISGFQFGLSYTPDLGDTGTAAPSNTGFGLDNNGNQENVFHLGVSYEQNFDAFEVSASATAEFGDSEIGTTEDLEAYAIGASLGTAGFTVAASYGTWEESGQAVNSGADADFWTLGAAYDIQNFGVSATYLDSEYGSNEFSNIVLGAEYRLAPGFTPYVEAYFFDFDPSSTTIADNDGNLFLVGTALNF